MAERRIIYGGTVDPHVHLREPGQIYKEGFVAGTMAAARGGYTSILDMPNNKRAITTPKRLHSKKGRAEGKLFSDVGFNFGSTIGSSKYFSEVFNEVAALKQYMDPTTGITRKDLPKSDEELETIFSRWPDGKVIMVHAEGPSFERVINVARKTRKAVHLCHMSLKSELEMVIEAKKEGLPVTCEVSAHHLLLNEDDAKLLPNGIGMMKPPLATKEDVQFLRDNIEHVDILTSDHAPHTLEEKNKFTAENGPYGIVGLETTIPLMLTEVGKGWITVEKVIDMISTRPREIFGIAFDPTTSVELVWDEEPKLINPFDFQSKAKHSPFANLEVTGRVANVFLHGHQILEEGQIVGLPQGKII